MKPEEMWDKSLGGEDTSNELTHWGGNLCYVVVGAICKVCWRYKVINRQNLRDFKGKCGVLVASNHTSYLDVVLMYCASRPSQWLRFIARDTLFEAGHGWLGQAISRAGAFPIKRGSADRTCLKRAAKHLKNKEVVGILPEGSRRNKGSMKPAVNAGAAFIVRMAGNVPILPMTVRNAEKVKNKGERLHFPKIYVEYGDPVLLQDFDFLPKADRLEACTWFVLRECYALFYEIEPEKVDMVALFPDDKDYTAVFAEHPIPRHTTAEAIKAWEELQG
ncbi:MAG: lysophospholipid acyltransferase family protein [Eggerthellaceae bacterium]|nr:lysophospholipid acyltransferase family protein [Eggerthellaceae bacterium]